MTKTLRKIVVIILALITVCSIISLTTACKTKIKFNYTLVAGGTAYEISSCTIQNPGFSEDGAMVIPSSYNGLPVIGIGSGCFEYEQSMFGSNMLFIHKLYLPSTIKYIKADAFKGQRGVRVYIEDLTAWCNISFESMYSNPLAGWCKRQDDGSGAGYSWDKTFYLNNVLTEDLVIPEGVTKINDYAFCGNAFKSVDLSNVTEIGAEAFSFSYKLESINISNSVEKIGEWAFASTPACQLSVGENVKEIGENAFFDNKHLVEVVNYSDSLTFTKGAEDNGYAAKYALGVFDRDSFEGSKIAIENGDVVYNDEGAKYLVRALGNGDSKVIPSGITAIYRYAFDHGVNEVVIPNTVNKFCEYAFYWCGEVKFLGTVEDWCKIEGITNLTYSRVNDIEIEGISNGEVELPAWMTEIPNGLFQRVVNLEKITLHEGVTVIGNYAFSHCKNLKTVIFPSSLVAINDYAFYRCENLQGSLNLPEGLTYIGEFAFSSCKSITGTVVIPKGVEKISRNAFSYCRGITSFKLQDGIKVIGAMAFYECSGLRGVFNLPSSIEKIGQFAFEYCSSTTIRYDGTKEQFRNVYKANYWDGGTIKEVVCDDGKFTL